MNTMKSLKESVVNAMDGTDVALFPFLPYILQDMWEIGASPKVITELVRKHTRDYSHLNILDLGCGKGAVSVRLAQELGCKCLGIDAIGEFIEEANKKAVEYGVAQSCRFEQGDIRKKIRELPQFDVIVLGAVGPVFGDYYSTLITLSKSLTENGVIVIDDGYIENESNFSDPLIQKRADVIRQISDADMHLLDETIISSDEMKDADVDIFKNLEKRCHELMETYPHKSTLFEKYLREQAEENDVLETKMVCSTMVIGKEKH